MLANNNYYIGIDLGGTRIKAGLVADGKLQALEVVPAVAAQGLKASLPLTYAFLNICLLLFAKKFFVSLSFKKGSGARGRAS
mgnify:CR=1 FL=1